MQHLIFLSFFLLTFHTVSTHFLIIFLQSSHVLSGLRELTLLHTLTHIPVHKGSLGIHQIKLMIQASPSLSNSSGVTQHAHSPLNLGQVSTWNHSRGLVVDANFETSGTPVYKLDRALGLDGGNGSIYIFGYHITTVEQAAGHVLAMAGITFNHLICWLKTGICDLSHS
ncbi:hypothetical protein Z043_106807 [Scleropages formosus]|uniref:Uncharacterized protein n=1 Tax=Scleropages formosus TaxID=113540 RepID=A0A0P7UIG5_SCLFO|nr:hypothetical protein Z043_106807 [Scleropages formosus]